MISDKQNIKFLGFVPPTLICSYVEEQIAEIQKEAPYRSTFNLVFTKKDHLLKGVITLNSSTGRFIAVAHGQRLDIVTQKLLKQIRKKIDRWKLPKFHRESFKDVFLNNIIQTNQASYTQSNG